MTIYVVLGTLALMGGLVAAAIWQARRRGRADEREEQSKKVIGLVEKAKKARDDIGTLSARERRQWLSRWARR